MVRPWYVRVHPRVREFIDGCEKVPQKKIAADIEKLGAYGEQASWPLVRQVEGKIWELRSEVDNHGLYRTFYYRSGPRSYHAYYAYKKGEQKLPDRVKERAIRLYTELTGEEP